METHIIHTLKEDFYGKILNVAIVGYLRPEKNFDSLESLSSAVQGDIEEAKKATGFTGTFETQRWEFLPSF